MKIGGPWEKVHQKEFLARRITLGAITKGWRKGTSKEGVKGRMKKHEHGRMGTGSWCELRNSQSINLSKQKKEGEGDKEGKYHQQRSKKEEAIVTDILSGGEDIAKKVNVPCGNQARRVKGA